MAEKDGVITVFLSLVLVLFMNFLLTTLEAARISGTTSYLTMLGINAGKAEEARYYYPLFEEYGLLAVDGGMGSTGVSVKSLEERMEETVRVADEESVGGLLGMTGCEIRDLSVTTLTSSGYRPFVQQVKQQGLYEGAELLCDFLKNDSLSEVEKVTGFQKSQQKAAEATAIVSIEILKLMQLVDGVCTDATGLKTDKNGKYRVADSFVKKLGICTEAQMKATYGSPLIFQTVQGDILYVRKAVDSLMMAMGEYDRLCFMMDKEAAAIILKTMYEGLFNVWNKSMEALEAAVFQAEVLRQAQKAAQSGVLQYESELLSTTGIGDGLLSGLLDELQRLKEYVGLTDSDYNAELIKKTLVQDLNVLQSAALPGINEVFPEEGIIDTEGIRTAVGNFTGLLAGYSYEHLIFDYGDLKAADTPKDMLTEGLGKLFSKGVFELLGVDNVSDKAVSGVALPSKGGSTSGSTDIMKLFSEMSAQLSGGGLGAALKKGYDSLSEDFLTEVYLTNHFNDFRAVHDGSTMIDYEREYILHGHKKDSENLMATAMELIALRAAFCFVAILTDGVRYGEAELLARSMAVFGSPALVYAVKYLILTVWAIEEAVVEVAALMAGKRVAIYNPTGNIALGELLALTPEMVRKKAGEIPGDVAGAGYSSYITLLSMLENAGAKNGRTLDVIQENIRYRYRDSFRIGNCIVSGKYTVSATIDRKFSTGFFGDKAYEITVYGEYGY